jgi:hypothetical protein
VTIGFYGAWTEPTNLSNVDITSYTYDFTNETASTTSLIRIRAYDNTSGYYSAYDQSNAVFIIVHKTKIGTIKIQATGGIVTLPIYDPNIGMAGKSQLRIQLNGKVGCLELVDTTDPNASPVRIRTSSAIKAVSK